MEACRDWKVVTAVSSEPIASREVLVAPERRMLTA
jgi:hypothetical protein